jgi:hypothetical protein
MPSLIDTHKLLLQQRGGLKNMLSPYLYGLSLDPELGWTRPEVPQWLQERMHLNSQSLHLVERQMLRALLQVFERLPTCSECETVASSQLRDGPFLCETHAQEHPTAQRVPWYDGMALMYDQSGGLADLATAPGPVP